MNEDIEFLESMIARVEQAKLETVSALDLLHLENELKELRKKLNESTNKKLLLG